LTPVTDQNLQRSITGFHRGDEEHWVAELSCGHAQHTRHVPPFVERDWVTTEENRASRLGTSLDCLRCDRGELPEGYTRYRRTAEFSESTVPRALLGAHSTKPGVWGLIRVEMGSLEYHVHAPFDTQETLRPGESGVVLPEVEHHLVLSGPVRFFVEFWRRS
jgi:tellurite methyltransferase